MLLYWSVLAFIGLAITGWLSLSGGDNSDGCTGFELWKDSLYYRQFLKSLSLAELKQYEQLQRSEQYKAYMDWCLGAKPRQSRVC